MAGCASYARHKKILSNFNGMLFYFSDRINQSSLKGFALAGTMDRIYRIIRIFLV